MTAVGFFVVVTFANGASGCGFQPAEAAPATGSTPSARRLTDWPGTEDSPRYSPDGLSIAFEAEVDGQTDLYLLSRSDGVMRRLTDSPSLDRRPAWSPDGERFAYVAVVDGKTDLFLRHADGTTTRLTDDALIKQSVRWDPDSRRLVFTVRSPQRHLWEIEVPPLPSPNSDERPVSGGNRMPRSTTVCLGALTLLTLASWSEPSPSFAQWCPVGEPPRPPLEIRPHWSPDGKRIAIVKNVGEEGLRNHDFHVNADGTWLRRPLAW